MSLDKALAATTLPMVQHYLESEMVGDYAGPLSIEFGESGPLAEIYFVRVPIKAGTTVSNVRALATALEGYCQNEEDRYGNEDMTASFVCDGREWMLGDGDDSGAVVFRDKAFNIWLRCFAPA